MRRLTFQLWAFTSTISSDLLQATKMDAPETEGWAHVGEHELSPAFGGSNPCPPVSCFMCPAAASGFLDGAPVIPISRPFVRTKWRDALSVLVSISTSMSSIMHAE